MTYESGLLISCAMPPASVPSEVRRSVNRSRACSFFLSVTSCAMPRRPTNLPLSSTTPWPRL